jgi:hypothetical protein
MLIETALDYAMGFDEEMEQRITDKALEGPGAAHISGSGKGGIRTLEGALHPLPA